MKTCRAASTSVAMIVTALLLVLNFFELCRQLLNDVWRQFTNISSPVTSTVNLDSEYSREVSEVGEFEAPEASNTTILVVGGSGRQAATSQRIQLSWQAHYAAYLVLCLVSAR